MPETTNQFQDFCSELGAQVGSMDAVVALESLDPQNRKVVGSVYENVIAFLADSNMVPQGRLDSRLDSSIESFVEEFNIRDVDPSQIISLVEKCGVHPAYFNQCCEEIALAVNNTGANGYAYADHFHPANDYNEQSFGANLEMMFAGQSSLYDNADHVSASLESFGKDVNGSISDVKLAATIAILRYHHSAIQRCLPVIPSTSNMVMYKVDYNEVYDLDQSRDADGKVRQGAHRVPFVELYDDPSPANTEPKQIIPLLASDNLTDWSTDGILKIDLTA